MAEIIFIFDLAVPDKLVIAPETQTEWSMCEDGLQHRRRDCSDRKHCGLESRNCGEAAVTEKRRKNKEKVKEGEKERGKFFKEIIRKEKLIFKRSRI
ncbi:hypothetical protein RB195_009741 [Necator americanus]|uniref:Uncharacterized protein n=1 Tax=Necator americanus TaxID=51031 RepID=A0ABR1CW68_NECAM